jgi:hypothetical protein
LGSRAVSAGSTRLEGAEELVDARPLARGHDEADGRLVTVRVDRVERGDRWTRWTGWIGWKGWKGWNQRLERVERVDWVDRVDRVDSSSCQSIYAWPSICLQSCLQSTRGHPYACEPHLEPCRRSERGGDGRDCTQRSSHHFVGLRGRLRRRRRAHLVRLRLRLRLKVRVRVRVRVRVPPRAPSSHTVAAPG